jgi:threonine/homoserine/homoserine lactone efflux protein
MANYEAQDLQYLQMMQENITRMAVNSANAKTWLVTIVTGFFAIGCSIKDLDWWLLLAIIPIVVFWYIDAYYLSLERALRNRLVPMVGNNPTLSIPFHV